MGIGSCSRRIFPVNNNRSQSKKNNLGGDFYWACRNGDLGMVKNIYKHLTYDQLNEIQPNGSTALHAACSGNYPHIVKFLLDNGCSRTILNNQNKIAYDTAATDEIRILFDRPWSNRFVQEQSLGLLNALNSNDTSDTPAKDLEIPDDWVTGHTHTDGTYEAQFMLALGKSSSFFKNIVKKRLEKTHQEELFNLLIRSIPFDHPEHRKAIYLFEKFRDTENIDHLLTLYTLETGFYEAVKKEGDALASILYLNLSQIQNRAFQGHTFRGVTMTENDLDAYRWALNKKESWHENLLETRTLVSMSTKKDQALTFVSKGHNNSNYSVLIEFDFPQICPTAIKLFQVSEQLQCLSEFAHESEVLLLPFTLFRVKQINVDPELCQYRILLTHEPTPKKSLRRTAAKADYF